MRSRAEVRGAMELALRVTSLALLAWMFWLSLDRGGPESSVSAGSANLASALPAWSRRGIGPDRIIAQLDSTPTAVERDWLAALSGSGSKVSWSGSLPAVAIQARPIASPHGGLRVLAASPAGRRVELADEIGILDSAEARNGGASFIVASASGDLRARVGGTSAHATIPDSVHVKRVLVIGAAGWEAKFVVAALEEDGWKVDAEMRVAPGVDVSQGSLSPMDTARYSAVIALDNTAASRASGIIRYAANGGGVVLAGSAASSDAFAALRPGTAGRQQGTAMEAEPGTISPASLSFSPIVALTADAIPLERRGAAVVSAARRFGAGRVIQQGYADTWRWRLNGDDASPEAHREWWTGTIASVAYTSPASTRGAVTDDAPVAGLIAALGPATSLLHANLAPARGSISLWWLFAFLSFCLLAEWASRRLRGSR